MNLEYIIKDKLQVRRGDCNADYVPASSIRQYFTMKKALFNDTLDRLSVFEISKMFDESLLDILVCPVSKSPLEYDAKNNELICQTSGLAYAIRGSIPVLLESEARSLSAGDSAAS
jgi:uncharacterized protein YbaR (Trm112 family)